MIVVNLNLQALPRIPLTMALMVELEPAQLRRLLKKGLRRGLSTDALKLCLDSDWGFALESESASELLGAELMVEIEARPQQAATQYRLHLHVVLEAPAFAWLICRDALQEA